MLFHSIARGIERKSVDISSLTWERLWGEGAHVKSGVSVNVDSALRNATGFGCGRVISEDCGSLPFKLYRARPDRGADLVPDHPYYGLIYERPNEWQTSQEFIELLTLHAVMTGNGYALKNTNSKGVVTELLPLLPNVETCQEDDWEITYRVPQLGGERFPAAKIFHLRGPGWNGYTGFDVVQIAREAFGLAIATEETHARFHKNSAKPSGLFSVDGTLSKEAYAQIKAQIEESKQSLANAHKTWIMDGGAKFTPITMTGVDSQHLETRRFQLEELCRFFRVIPQMVMHGDKTATFAASESHFIAHVVYCIRIWARRWEQTVKRELLSGRGDERVFAKMNLAALMRGDSAARSGYFSAALGSGGSPAWMTQNEVRELEELNPLDGGDELAQPMSQQPAADGAAPQGKAFNPLQSRAPAGGSDGGQWDGDGSGGDKPASRVSLPPGEHLSAINNAARAGEQAAEAGSDTSAPRAAFQAALDVLANDKTVTNSQLRQIAEQFVHGTGVVLGRTRQELIDEIGHAYTQQIRFINKIKI